MRYGKNPGKIHPACKGFFLTTKYLPRAKRALGQALRDVSHQVHMHIHK
jgi:hypothetical protein